MDLLIRRAEPRDVEGMSVVVDSAWRTNYGHIFTEEQIKAFTGDHRRKSFTKMLDDGKNVFVLLSDGSITAVCAAQGCDEVPFCEYAEIIQLYVLPEYQRKGLGKKLLSHAFRNIHEQGFKGVVLYTAEKNENACRFYEKFGFTARKSKEYDGLTYILYTIDF